ncbi:hypothetical protein [Nocardioides sp.]|uniref:hypothetical protein n=1 Tax=Nocardioides sp. TaxID=35761 RepID=UPI0035137038
MRHLRPTALAGLLLVLVPAAGALSSCGFDYPTDRVNTIAGGVNNRDGLVDALGVRVLASKQGEGRLIGALANNVNESASLDTVTSPDGRVTAGRFAPVLVGPRAGVNLSTQAQIPLTGDFTAGDFVKLQLGFSNGETLDLEVPVVKACYQYTQVPGATKPAESAAGDEAEGEAEGPDATFTCSDQIPTPKPEGGEE